MKFTAYSNEHLDTCLAIFDSNVPRYFSTNERDEFIQWLNELEPQNPYWLAWDDDEIVGCGGIYAGNSKDLTSDWNVECGFAWGMVFNHLHKKGYGKALFHFRLDYLKKNHPELPIILRTINHTYTFFAKYGFETYRWTKDGFEPGMDKYEMIYHDPEEAIMETERFRIRKVTMRDGYHFLELNGNPNVLTYLPGIKPFTTLEEGEADCKLVVDQYKKHGVGRFLAVEKTTGDVCGWVGLKWLEDEGVMDIGWRLKESHWGKGVATETAKPLLNYGHEELKQKRIIAHALVDNAASIKIMQKIGMTFSGNSDYKGHPVVEYESIR